MEFPLFYRIQYNNQLVSLLKKLGAGHPQLGGVSDEEQSFNN